jgi:FMN-dependent NADH-azoreductase
MKCARNPSGLRGGFDYVLSAGETFRYSEAGPQGLLGGKRVIVIESRGGLYSDGPGWAMDFQEPYLRPLLQFVGITDVGRRRRGSGRSLATTRSPRLGDNSEN